MSRQFVTEAVMVAIYGQLLTSPAPVEYMVPYTSLLELYEFQDSTEPLMDNPMDDQHVKRKVSELISYFEEPLNQKKFGVRFRCLGPRACLFYSMPIHHSLSLMLLIQHITENILIQLRLNWC